MPRAMPTLMALWKFLFINCVSTERQSGVWISMIEESSVKIWRYFCSGLDLLDG